METTYYSLASKASFNKALRHFFAVNDAVESVESKTNIADFINELVDDEDIHQDQLLPMIGAVIRDKFEYSFYSFNIKSTISDFQKIQSETIKWNLLDLVAIYFAPDGKRFIVNPKSLDSWERTREIHKDQLMVIYIKYRKELNKSIEEQAIKTFAELISGKDVYTNKSFVDQNIIDRPQQVAKPKPASTTAASAAPSPSAPSKPKKVSITPKYGVQVSNELFHNGNVEAWKKILESYHAKYPDLTVHVMYDNEVINDINSLFKWGKVKHGDLIFFQVSGENIMGVSKLQKYFYEGASPRYEQFLKLGVGRVLNIF